MQLLQFHYRLPYVNMVIFPAGTECPYGNLHTFSIFCKTVLETVDLWTTSIQLFKDTAKNPDVEEMCIIAQFEEHSSNCLAQKRVLERK